MSNAVHTAGVVGLLALISGCADEEDCDRPLMVCDIASPGCQDHVFVQTACARGHGGRVTPPVNSISRLEFEAFLREGDEPTPDQVRVDAQLATALRMLALLPPGQTSSREAAIAAYAASVLAFYTREDASVTIVETNLGEVDRETAVFVLSHEFVHAQQDVDIGLGALFDEHATTADAATAVRSVTEGEAVHYSNVTLARQSGASITPEIFADFYARQQQGLRDAAGGTADVSLTDLSSAFPYPFGGELVTRRWLSEGDAGVLELYDAPPPSTAAVLRSLAGDAPRDAVQSPPLRVDPLPEGWSVIADDTLGAWILFALARRSGFDEPTADAMARDWTGDRLLVVGGPTTPEVAVAWSVRFGDEGTARALGELSAALPEGVRRVEHNGRDVTMVLAVDDDALTRWAPAFQTAASAEHPSFRRGAAERERAVPLPRLRPGHDPLHR